MVKDRKNISSSSKINPHFFKVYFPALSSQRLKIPTDYINNFNGVVPKKTILKGPLGRFWHVEMEKVEDDFFIQKGWQCFVKDRSLKLGEFLLFRYDGNSVFDVKIFDNSGCEKEETLAYRNSEKMICFVKEEAKPEARETVSKPTRGFKRKYSERSLKKIGKTSCGRLKRTAIVKVKEDVVFDAADFVEPNHPHFTAFVPSRPYELNIPKPQVTKNGLKIKPEMILRDPSGKSWPVKTYIRKDGRILFSRGWLDFRRGNNLMKGDKCIFEVIKGRGSKGNVMNVQIFQAGAGTGTSTRLRNRTRRETR